MITYRQRQNSRSAKTAKAETTTSRNKNTMSTTTTTTTCVLMIMLLSTFMLLGAQMKESMLLTSSCLSNNNDDDSAGSTGMPQPTEDNNNTPTAATVHNTQTWPNWPAVAHEQVGHPLVFKGDTFYHHAREHFFGNNGNLQLMQEFLEVYKHRPDPVNMCGIRINHAMALFLAVKVLQPTLVVESGVNAGVSTYFIRKASNTTKIIAIDPEDKPICGQGKRWLDEGNPLTTYYLGKKNFVDLLELDWQGMVDRKEVDPASTLVFLDDHLHTFDRVASCMMKFGVQHVVVEDNYKAGEGATKWDKRSTPKQAFSGRMLTKEGKWLFQNLVAYAEFPPLVPSIMAKNYLVERKKAGGFMSGPDKNEDIVAPILRPDLDAGDMQKFQDIASYLELNATLTDRWSYLQFMNYNQICYLQLVPTPDAVIQFHNQQQQQQQ